MARAMNIVFFCLILLIPSFGIAAGSGTTIGLSADDRMKRIENFYTQLVKSKKTEFAYREALVKFRSDFADARRTCRADLRRANRDTKLPALVRCLRTETILQRDFAKVQLETLSATPGISVPVRKEALRSLGSWIEALDAVISGIDAGVYTLEEDLRETKQNLFARYHQPLLQTLILLRADHALSWTAFVYSRLEEARREEEGKNPSIDPAWDAATACLENGEQQLLGIPPATVLERKSLLFAAFTHLHGCIGQIENLPVTPEGTEE